MYPRIEGAFAAAGLVEAWRGNFSLGYPKPRCHSYKKRFRLPADPSLDIAVKEVR
jgi:hypothetical protein